MIITLGGRAGSGTSSAVRALAKRLGYKFYCAGDIRRKFAVDKSITLAELNEMAEKDPYSDKLVDDEMKRMSKTENNLVVDAWLGFYFFPDSIKIFLDADIKVRAKRILERANFEEHPKSLREAIKMVKEREASGIRRYDKLYSVNPFDHNHFDLVLDTTNHTVEETAEQTYKFVMNKLEK